MKFSVPQLIVCVIVLFVFTGCYQNKTEQSEKRPDYAAKEQKDPNKLYPQELFFLDRNYPDYNIPHQVIRQRIDKLIRFDKGNSRSGRSLDYPWTVEGPGNIGGRVNTIAIHPLNSQNILIGFSQGGIYHTQDGGMNWRPVFDDQPTLSISHITFDLQNPDRVYAATGDVNISGYPFVGSGVYRSEDGGLTWEYLALGDKGIISKIFADPHDPQIVYAASMGFPSHKGDERGLFRSIDGGETWIKTLTIDDSTGVIDLALDPGQPGTLYATSWTRIRTNKYSTTSGPGTSVYKSIDFGASWENVTTGLPSGSHSRTSVEVTNDGTVFVSYMGTPSAGACAGENETLSGLYRSIDGGATWDTLSISPNNGLFCDLFGNFGWYFEAIKVNPEDPNDIFLLGVDLYRTVDGGQWWFEAAPPWWFYEVHADKHDLQFASGKMYLATDGGAYSQSIDGFTPWEDIENIPATQFYRTAYNPHQPDHYFGGAQDNGTTGGHEGIFNDWPRIFGGDGFQPLFDPDEPSWMYALTQNGSVWYTDGSFFDSHNQGLYGTRYWDMPFIMSPHDSKILFAASHTVFKINMLDTLREWMPISPDLTKGDTILGNRYPAITALAQSELDEQRLYAGTQDGKMWTTADGGDHWTDISSELPDRFVTSIATSSVDPGGVYVTYSGYRDNDHTPYIYHSGDAGETWTGLGANMPLLGVNNLLVLPGWNDAVLLAATDGGVYVSQDGGAKWARVGTNFPYMPVYDLEYNPVENKIVAATFSRGLMTFPIGELDLVSSVEGIDAENMVASIKVYPAITKDEITIDFGELDITGVEPGIFVTNTTGQVIQRHELTDINDGKVRIDLSADVGSGLYILIIKDAERYLCSKTFIKM